MYFSTKLKKNHLFQDKTNERFVKGLVSKPFSRFLLITNNISFKMNR